MIRNSRRATAVAIAGIFAFASAVSGCAAGAEPETALPTQLTEGVNTSKNGVAIRNLFVLGPIPGQRLAPGSSAPVYVFFVNDDTVTDQLVSVTAPGLAQSATLPSGGVTLPKDTLVPVGGQGRDPILLTGLVTELRGGEYVKLTLQFSQAGVITVNTPVVPRQGEYATFPPVPDAQSSSATPTGGVAPTGSVTPTGGATPTGGESPGRAP